jgi:hypothetical protein
MNRSDEYRLSFLDIRCIFHLVPLKMDSLKKSRKAVKDTEKLDFASSQMGILSFLTKIVWRGERDNECAT